VTASGWPVGDAAQTRRPSGGAAGELLPALLSFDCAAAQAAFDRVFAARSMDAALRDVVLPAMHEIGERWARGEITVAQEHFATEIVSGRLRSLGREFDHGLGPRVILAGPSAERHDIGLLCCALALHFRGWRVTYLGPDTPTDAIERAVEVVDPDVVVIGAVQRHPLRLAAPALSRLAAKVTLAVGGGGVSPELATAAGARHLNGDPVTAAASLTAAMVQRASVV
jgi:methanogenic corrinoid protein MtbC1